LLKKRQRRRRRDKAVVPSMRRTAATESCRVQGEETSMGVANERAETEEERVDAADSERERI
jgi:hypothetical protein